MRKISISAAISHIILEPRNNLVYDIKISTIAEHQMLIAHSLSVGSHLFRPKLALVL